MELSSPNNMVAPWNNKILNPILDTLVGIQMGVGKTPRK